MGKKDWQKPDEAVFEWGKKDWQKPGERTDLKKIAESIRDGMSLQEAAILSPSLWAQYGRRLKDLRDVLNEKERKIEEKELIILIGPTGTGKTEMVYKENNINDIYRKTADKWWDEYEGESVVLFDQVVKGSIKLADLLKWSDKYPRQGEVRRSFCQLTFKKIYITSNNPIESWFPKDPQEKKDSLYRRIDRLIYTKINEKPTEINPKSLIKEMDSERNIKERLKKSFIKFEESTVWN